MARTGRSQVLTTPPVEGCMVSKPRFGTAKKRVKRKSKNLRSTCKCGES